MAMTKKDLALLDSLQAQLALATSLRDLTIHAPQRVAPHPSNSIAPVEEFLWWVNPYNLLHSYGSQVAPASSYVGMGRRRGLHSHSNSASGTSFAQGPGVFYATRRDALLALRDAVVERMGACLASVDAELAKED